MLGKDFIPEVATMNVESIFGPVIRKVSKYMRGVKLPGAGLEKLKRLESIRIKTYDKVFAERLKKVYKNFPNIEELPPYLKELLELKIGSDRLKLALGRIKSVLRALEGIRDDILFKIRKARSRNELKALRRQYLARVYEVLRDIEEDLRLVSRAKKELRRLPPLRDDRPTIVLAGFPNVGKSSLLKALTGSEPEIAPYPFTTKRLLLGHFSDGYRLIQVIDTPGVLDRPVEKMKQEEKDAIVSMKYFADVIVFILDPFQDLESQRNLLNYLKGILQKPLIVVVGKADLLENPEEVASSLGAEMAISPLTGYNVDRLKKKLIKMLEGIKW